MKISRRQFLRSSAAIGGSLLVGSFAGNPGRALAAPEAARFAVLQDLTRCVGCRRCEAACNKVNELPAPEVPFEAQSVFAQKRRPDDRAYTVVNRYQKPSWKKPIYRKVQCNHCAEPACASACLVGALKKTREGPVTYNENVCIGCRYCMVACPFSIPAFEYFDARSPTIRKCTMCYHRIYNGIIPACVRACAVGALAFGKRGDLLKLARDRLKNEPDRYIDHIYGELEVGGTDWLYISGVPFEQLDFPRDLGITPYPEFTREFLSAVPLVLVVWPALLSGFYAWTKRREQMAEGEAQNCQKEGAP